MSSASAAGDIRTALEEIWSASPSDLQRLAAIHRPPSRESITTTKITKDPG